MISFKEFLTSQEDRLRAERSARVRSREKWIAAVAALIDRMEGWIKQSDPHGLVQLRRFLGESPDEGIDSPMDADRVENLDIVLGNQGVRVRPVAMDLMGPRWKPAEGRWGGRVDLIGHLDRYELFRFVGVDEAEQWHLRNSQNYQMKLLDQEGFDSALVDLFS